MKKQQFIDMQELGTSSIPNLLLTNYQQLGLNETELVLLLKIKMHLEKGSFFQRQANCRQACLFLWKSARTD